MFCPQCKAEYKEDVNICTDCQIALVGELPKESHELEYDYMEIVSSLNQGDIALIKSIFDDGEIDYQVLGEEFNSVRPLLEPARFIVREDQVEIAKELLKGLELHIWGVSKRTKHSDEDDE